MIDTITPRTARRLARVAGLVYLINILGGLGILPALIIVPGDAAATAHNIVAQELLYRVGLVVHIIVVLTNVPMTVIYYLLFNFINKGVALMLVSATLVGTAIEATTLTDQFAPLTLLSGAPYLNAFSVEQLQAQAYALLRSQTASFNIATVFYSCYCLSIGYLIFRSTLLPRIVGVLMALAGVCYFTNSIAFFIAPSFDNMLFPYILLPCLIGEASLCLTMLAIGIDDRGWVDLTQARERSAAGAW